MPLSYGNSIPLRLDHGLVFAPIGLPRIWRKFHFEALLDTISFSAAEDHQGGSATIMRVKGAHFGKDIILTYVRWYLAYSSAIVTSRI